MELARLGGEARARALSTEAEKKIGTKAFKLPPKHGCAGESWEKVS